MLTPLTTKPHSIASVRDNTPTPNILCFSRHFAFEILNCNSNRPNSNSKPNYNLNKIWHGALSGLQRTLKVFLVRLMSLPTMKLLMSCLETERVSFIPSSIVCILNANSFHLLYFPFFHKSPNVIPLPNVNSPNTWLIALLNQLGLTKF